MTFRVGQKVVCVKAESFNPFMYPDTCLRENAIYTVALATDWYGVHAVELVELRSPHITGLFQAEHFRPAVERKTDISIFKWMLIPSNSKIEKIGAAE